MPPSHPLSGQLIVIEGIDGTGKSTQAKLLAETLTHQGAAVVLSREPTDGPWGRKARESASSGRLSPQDELDLFLLDRRDHVENLILPALQAGKIVVLDRYYFSTMAYQGCRGFNPQEIRRTNEAFAPTPHHLLILDLDVDTALQRIGTRGDIANEFEKRESLEFCRQLFLTLQQEPFAHLISSTHPPSEVHRQILKALDLVHQATD